MEQSPSPVALWVQWQVPGDAPYADHLAAVAVRQQGSGLTTSPRRLYAIVIGLALVFPLAAWPGGLLLTVPVLALVVWARFGARRQLAKTLRGQPTVDDPYTVTLDAEGFHVVSPNVADHLRWTIFEAVTVNEEVLVLRNRGTRLIRVIPLATLDPSVDRTALVAEVGRLIEASAP